MKKLPRLVHIHEEHTVTQGTDPEFWLQCQRAILRGLKDTGVLQGAVCLCGEELLIQPDRQQCADQGERKL